MRRVAPSVLLNEGEDVTNQAGWMYADLFLALMVIFLATISFVPQLTQTGSDGKTLGVAVNSFNYTNGMAIVYKDFDLAKIQSDIAKFESANKIPNDSQILFTQIIGGYDATKEDANAGTLTAIGFSVKVKNQGQNIFGNSTISINTSPLVPKGEVALRLTFAPKFG
jgi:hypothetical protein